jgi:hypothetical protein
MNPQRRSTNGYSYEKKFTVPSLAAVIPGRVTDTLNLMFTKAYAMSVSGKACALSPVEHCDIECQLAHGEAYRTTRDIAPGRFGSSRCPTRHSRGTGCHL